MATSETSRGRTDGARTSNGTGNGTVRRLTVGYMISRGIAKAGVRDPYWAERGDSNSSH